MGSALGWSGCAGWRRLLPTGAAILWMVLLPPPAWTQQIDMNAAQAAEEFRWGVQAFHDARFGEAIVSFNRALAYQPQNHLARQWLGRAYYRAGYEEAALSEWEFVIESRAASAQLVSFFETVRYRRGLGAIGAPLDRWVRSSQFAGVSQGARLFSRPNGVAALANGSIYLSATAIGQVLRIGPNGRVEARLLGGLEGLNRPFGLALTPGNELLVAEFGADRLTLLSATGSRIVVTGGPGVEPGKLLGPQYVTIDSEGFWYVTEWANRRVSKFSPSGQFVAIFGRPNAFFGGLAAPTGIVYLDGHLMVADRAGDRFVLHRFDTSGNFVDSILLPWSANEQMPNLEGLSHFGDSTLLIAAGRAVYLYDVQRRAVLAEIQDGAMRRVTAAVRDANRRVLVSDFNAGSVGIFEPESLLYSGLQVIIERIVTTQYPTVGVQVLVTDRDGRPIVGLEPTNFVLSELGLPQESLRLDAAGHLVDEFDLAILLDVVSTPAPAQGLTQGVFVVPPPQESTDTVAVVSDVVREIAQRVPGAYWLSLLQTGAQPRRLLARPATPERFGVVAREATIAGGEFGMNLDRAIRLAAADLLTRSLRRRVVLITHGAVQPRSFPDGIEELAAFLRNNGVALDIIQVASDPLSNELRYLARESGGLVYGATEPAGLAPLFQTIRTAPSGRYWLTYQSRAATDFGRAYIPVAVEAQLLVRSGRDETGFFGPLRF